MARRTAVAALLAAAALALAALWRWTDLAGWVDLPRLTAMAAALKASPAAAIAVPAAFVAAGLVLVPLTLLIAATMVVFDPIIGAVYALAGALASAATTYWLGRSLGHDVLQRSASAARLSRMLGRGGVAAVAAVRLVPVAPFTIVNLLLGAARIGFGTFVAGSALGLLPGIVVLGLAVDRTQAAIREPNAVSFGLLGALVLAVAALVTLVRRRLERA